MPTISKADQFSGCLVGQCLGDALGFPVEGSPPDICASYVEQLPTPTVQQTLPTRRNYASGQYTDDSQLARELMVSYAELERFDPSDYARRIRSIFSENRIVGRGWATDAANRRLMADVPWEEAWYALATGRERDRHAGRAGRAAFWGRPRTDDPGRARPRTHHAQGSSLLSGISCNCRRGCVSSPTRQD
jgi:ADP-ribosylglycohydrolase